VREQLEQLRSELEKIQTQLIDVEADFADRLAEIKIFEHEYERRVGHLLDRLETLEEEVREYNERIQRLRKKDIYGYGYVPVDEQIRRAWKAPPAGERIPQRQPVNAATEKEIKQLYRQLARRFHPDLATDEFDHARRTQRMAAINEAYAARSLAELRALAQQSDASPGMDRDDRAQTTAQMVDALRSEIARCQRRIREVENELRNIPNRPSVQLSLEVKWARRAGRDLLKEMAADIEKKIARKTVERDMLKAQFDRLGLDEG
jgi:hypothetical protein